MPQTQVSVQVLDGHWQVQASMPADRLALAMAHAAGTAAEAPAAALDELAVRRYLQGRVWAEGPEGTPWSASLVAVQMPGTDRDEWGATWRLEVPAGASGESVRLHYEAITREIATHVAVFVLSQDWARGDLPQQPRWLGRVSHRPLSIDIHRTAPAPLAAARGLMGQGFWHMVEGADHLLFVFTLWLTAGLRPQPGRWQTAASARAVWRDMGWRVSAFTLGHSLALLMVALHWLPPAGPLVEALIALSVGLCAWHAYRPLFPQREVWVVGAFGCIHGMAFAEGLSALKLSTVDLLWACLSFNLGLELAQLLLVAVLAPLGLWWTCSPRALPQRLRLLAAALAGLCAAVWLVQRLAA